MARKPGLSDLMDMKFITSIKRFFKNFKHNPIHIYSLSGATAVLLLIVMLSAFSKPRNEKVSAADNNVQALIDIMDTVFTPTPALTPSIKSPDATAEVIVITPPASTPPEKTLKPAVGETPEPVDIPVPTVKPTPTPAATPEPTPTPTPLPDLDELVEYYMVEADKYYNEMGYSSNTYEYTEDEMYMLAQVIHGEAHGEPYIGKIAVGNVVMNRVLSRGFPGKTIKEVVTAPNQFTGYSSSIRPCSNCKSAAALVLQRENWQIPQNVYFFHSNRPEGVNWGSHKFYKKIGGHCFYTESYSGRSRNGLIPPELFERTFKWPQFGCKPENRVHRIQYMLNKLGYDVKADGYFGLTTKESLMEFQLDKKLKADGIAGPSTIKALIKAYGIENYVKRYLD